MLCTNFGGTIAFVCHLGGRFTADAVACQPRCQSQQPTPATIPPSDLVPPPPPPEPPLGEGARRFLRRVARVYEEVLESRANPQTDDTFVAVLGLVSEEAGILLPRGPAKLAEVVQGA